MTRPIRITVDLSALRGNFAVAREYAGAARLWAVVKAHAYGHGLLRTVCALDGLANGFALLDIGEAVALREAGFYQPILLLEGFFTADELPLFAEHHLTAVLHSPEQLQMLASVPLPTQLPVYLKLDTNMHRLGFSASQFPAVLAALARIPQVESITLMTHFADADGERGIAEQLARFAQITAGCQLPVSLANSAALLRFSETCIGWARPGIMLYGASPFPERQSAAQLGLRPVMTLSSEVIAVRELQPDSRVGYGGLFTAKAPMRVGTVACGYADGYPRHAPTGTPVLVAGRRTRILGRVSMDMLAVDLTDIPDADIGAPVVLWGEGLPVEEVATAAGTISYELLCALAPRVPVVEKE